MAVTKYFSYYILLSIVVFSCSDQQAISSKYSEVAPIQETEQFTDEKTEASDNIFRELCEQLPRVELPYSVSCFDCCTQPDLSGTESKIQDYLPEGSAFVGVIHINNNYTSILATYSADWLIPVVVVLTPEGKYVDEEVFMGGYCGSDFGYLGKQYFHITRSNELVELDTGYYVTYNDDYNIIDTTKTETTYKRFLIGEGGIRQVVR